MADLKRKGSFIQALLDSKSIVMDRTPGLSDGKRATSDPQIPEDLKPSVEVGATVSHVDTINLGLNKLNIVPA
jgi:hypothetical protein